MFLETGAGGLNQPVSLVFSGLPRCEFRLNGEHGSDGDLVNNLDDDGTGNIADTDDDNDNLPDLC